MEQKKISRRQFLKSTGAVVGGAVVGTSLMGFSGCSTAGDGAAGWVPPHNANSPIFQPTRIGSLELKNKMIKAALLERRSDINGSPTPALLRMWDEESAGGISMLMFGSTRVLREDIYGGYSTDPTVGGLFTGRGGFYDASQIPAFREGVDIVHRNGAKAMLQLSLAGTFQGRTIAEIRQRVDAFANSVVLARDAGFDAINFHFAHGYHLSQSMSHWANTRTDEYGGNPQNRARFVWEIVEACRRAVGNDLILTAKIDGNDWRLGPGGSPDMTNFTIQGMVDRGLDAVEVSGNQMTTFALNSMSKDSQNFFARYARFIADGVDVPLILTGGVRNVQMMEDTLRHNDKIVAFGMVRTLFAEPDLPNKWAQNTNYEPKCIACNWRFDILFSGPRALCVFDQGRA
jgi:2,4-dienoyl-CoA reductase-like NADH-dependent reductase (Old Yellow Enzyme family)